jgi:SAM-dependent methyltransferase
MRLELLDILRCPRSRQPLALEKAEFRDGQVFSGWLIAAGGGSRYPIRDFIPRFVGEANYADSFGMQWNKFGRTQLDSFSGLPISAERFWDATGWDRAELDGKWTLDGGCGSGRFAEVAISAGAKVVAIDYSSAVDAAHANLGKSPLFHAVQADLYALPFADGTFSFAYSLGVLQHTPDVEKAFGSLPPMLERGGSLCVDFYEMTLKHRLLPRHLFRPFTTRMKAEELFEACQRWVPRMLPLSQAIGRIPGVGKVLKRVVPVADYTGLYELNDKQLSEWALLDTFDWLSPRYDQPQRRDVVTRWIAAAGFREWMVFKSGFMIVRGFGKL